MSALTEAGVDYSARLYADAFHSALPSSLDRLIGPSLPPSSPLTSRGAPPYDETAFGLERTRSRWIAIRRHAYRTMLVFLKNNCWNSTTVSSSQSPARHHHQTSDHSAKSLSSNVVKTVGGNTLVARDDDDNDSETVHLELASAGAGHVMPIAADKRPKGVEDDLGEERKTERRKGTLNII